MLIIPHLTGPAAARRLRFDYNAVSDRDLQKTITTASEILVRHGILRKPADSDFFANQHHAFGEFQ